MLANNLFKSDSLRETSLNRKRIGTRKINTPKRNSDKVIEGAESIETGFNSICMRFAPVLLKENTKKKFF